MRWTIRGIPDEMAAKVRNVAYETRSTLGEVVALCVDIAIDEARRRLNSNANGDPLLKDLRELRSRLAQLCHIVNPER